MDPELLTYLRLTDALDTVPSVALVYHPATGKALLMDAVAPEDAAAVEERFQGVEWAPYVPRVVPLHTWFTYDSAPRTLLERLQAAQQAAIDYQTRLQAIVAELQAGAELDPSWPADVLEWVRQLKHSFGSRTGSPEEDEDSTGATEAPSHTAPESEATAPETVAEPSEATAEAVPETGVEEPFSKKKGRKGRSVRN